jgi:hypothetical protein
MNTLNHTLKEINKLKEKIKCLDYGAKDTMICEIDRINDEIYNIYKVILEISYDLKEYEIFYKVVGDLKDYIREAYYKKFFIECDTTREQQYVKSETKEKVRNILSLLLDDKQNLKYELLMASLGSSTAYNRLEKHLLANEYPIEDIKKAKEELEQNLSKYVKDDEIETVKEKLNIIFEYLSKISKS